MSILLQDTQEVAIPESLFDLKARNRTFIQYYCRHNHGGTRCCLLFQLDH